MNNVKIKIILVGIIFLACRGLAWSKKIDRDHGASFIGNKNITNEKIVGGIPANVAKYPHMAITVNLGGVCSATILNSWSLLSVAHCFDHNTELIYIMVLTGSQTISVDDVNNIHNVAEVVVHPDYNQESFRCDIALIFLKQPVVFANDVKKAVLTDNDKWMKESSKKFIVAGWGTTEYQGDVSRVGLLSAQMSYVSRKKCSALNNMHFTADMFCLYGDGKRDTCQGDSGGGVLFNGTIVGLVSHGEKCAVKDKPSIFVNVFYFLNWIKSTVETYIEKYCVPAK